MINKDFITIVTDDNLLYVLTVITCYFLKFISITEKKLSKFILIWKLYSETTSHKPKRR